MTMSTTQYQSGQQAEADAVPSTAAATSTDITEPQIQTSTQQQVTEELEQYKLYLSEAQDELQQLQTQLLAAKKASAASAHTVDDLKHQLQQAQQQNSKLQEDHSTAADAQQQLAGMQQQLTAAKQQLAAAKEAAATKQSHMQEMAQKMQLQEQQHKQQEQLATEQLAAAKGHTAAAKAEARELRRAEAAASQQLTAVSADLEAARAAERSALADARRARAAEASRAKQLAEAEEQLGKCREQLALAGDIHSQLSRLQSALQEHKRQQRSNQADAEHSREQQHALLAELSQYKSMLSEAQDEVAKLESDSRQLQALRRWSSAAGNPALRASMIGNLCSQASSSSINVKCLPDKVDLSCLHQYQEQRDHKQQQMETVVSGDAPEAAKSISLLTQLCIPDTLSRSHSMQGTPGQPAIDAAVTAVLSSLCPSNGNTPNAAAAAAAAAAASRLGLLPTPPVPAKDPPACNAAHDARSSPVQATQDALPLSSSNSPSRIPAAPSPKQTCQDSSKDSGVRRPTSRAGHLLSASAPTGAGITLKQAAQAAATASAAAGVVTDGGQAPAPHGLRSSHTGLSALPVPRKSSYNGGNAAAIQQAAPAGTVPATATPRRRSSAAAGAAPVPLADALQSPRAT